MYALASESQQFGKRALTLETFPRGDYKNNCALFVFYLGVFQVFTFIRLVRAMKQGIVTAVLTKGFLNVADKRYTG